MDRPLNPNSAAECVEKVGLLRPLPAIAMEVAALADDPNSRSEDLEWIIESDPELAASIIRGANASYFQAPKPQVQTVRRAIVTLGLAATKNLVLGMCVQKVFSARPRNSDLDRWDFWRHCVASAAAAKAIACLVAPADEDSAFLAGLLHDIGKPILDEVSGERFSRAIFAAQRTGKELWKVERAIFSFDHADVGGLAALRWRLPEPAPQAIAAHHQPTRHGDKTAMAAVVAIADALAHSSGYGFSNMGAAPAVDPLAVQGAGLTSDDVAGIATVIDDDVSRIMDMFAIPAEARGPSQAPHLAAEPRPPKPRAGAA